jgi:hypothetical protein
LRHACSFEAHFAPSSDLLWCPNNNDGGKRLHIVEEAIENAMVPVIVVGAKGSLRHTGEKCFVQLMMIPNFGGSWAQQCIQVPARLGLIPVIFCEFAFIDGAASSKSAPALYLKKTCPCPDDFVAPSICQCSAAIMKSQFFHIIDTLREHPLAITDLICKNTACIAWNLYETNDSRKQELLFWDKFCDPASFQNLIVYCGRKSRKHFQKLVIYHCGEWKALEVVISQKTDLSYWSSHPDVPGFSIGTILVGPTALFILSNFLSSWYL